MNQSIVAIIVGLAAAVGGVLLAESLRTQEGTAVAGATDLSGIEARLREIELRLPAAGSGGAQLSGSGIPTALLDRLEAIERALTSGGAAAATGDSAAAPAGSLARIDQRLASIEESLSSERASAKPERVAKKRVSLAEAATELELSGQQEDELRQIYERFHERMYKIAAGPEGDPEAVKRDVAEAAKDPAKRMGLVGKYMPKVIGNFAGLMEAQTERETAIHKLLGPQKAERLERDFDVKEDNVLGLGGRAEIGVEAR